MKIVHVITRLVVGGAQENTILTCEGLHQRGHAVTLISGETHGPEGRLLERVRSGGYSFIEIPDLVREVSPLRDWRAYRMLRRLCRELRADVVHTHSSKAGILGRFAAAGAPAVVHTIHGMSFNRTQSWPTRRLYAWLERWAARRTDVIAAVADAMIEQSVRAGVAPREKFATVYSGMEVERFDPALYDGASARAAWGAGPEHIVVGTVARLFRKKGYEQLIPIMARAADQDSRLRFVWVGDGAQRAEYESELHRRGLAARTTLTGLVAPSEIPGLLAGFDILAHTSQWEGLPRAAVQALLMRVPVVAFAIDGTPEVVIDGATGRLAPLGNEDAFTRGLTSLAQDAELRQRMGAAGRERCLARFDWRNMVTQLERLYEGALRKAT